MLFKSIKKRREQKLRKYCVELSVKNGYNISVADDIYKYIIGGIDAFETISEQDK